MSLRSIALNLFCIFSSFFLYSSEEIRVELSTQVHLSSIYIGNLQTQNSSFSPSFLSSIRDILCFDLAHSGYFSLCQKKEELEALLSHNDQSVAFVSSSWEKATVAFVIKMVTGENFLDVFAFDVKNGVLKKFEKLPLSGNLSLDRGQIHKLSNALLKTLLGVEGIADTHLLYSVQVDNLNPEQSLWKAEIWQCDADGKNAKQITYEHEYSITPVFIPQHSTHGNDRFLYVTYKNGQPKIYYSSLRGRTGKPLISLRGNQLLPAMSRQRDKIAFISDATGRADLFLQKFDQNGMHDGKPEQLFSYPRSTQASPTFSPDGKKIAFVSDKDGTPRIYLIFSTTTNHKREEPTLITKRNRENTCPCWSPDGTKIAYSAKTNGIRQIWIVDVSTMEERQITTGPGNKENPYFARDSLHLVFNSTDPDSSELYMINLNQPEAVLLTSGPGKKHYPTWGE